MNRRMAGKKKNNDLDTINRIKKSKRRFRVILAATFVGVLLITFAGVLLMRQYETAMLRVYSEQQDAYVQLVVDQINLQPERTDEEIISKIVGTLDSGDSHYWTLSKNETLIFVKNVTETNRYLGIRNDEFYGTDSATAFMEQMTLYRVQHDIILIDGVRFVASGVLFEYEDNIYKICLLTNETVVLDNNDFLSTKINMCIYVILLILLILVVMLAAENIVHRKQLQLVGLEQRIRNQNIHMSNLEEELESVNSYDSRWNLYNYKLLGKFAETFDKKGIKTVTYVCLKFASDSARSRFLQDTQMLLDARVLRFDKSETELSLLFVNEGEPETLRQLERAGATGSMIAEVRPFDYDYGGPLAQQLKEYL